MRCSKSTMIDSACGFLKQNTALLSRRGDKICGGTRVLLVRTSKRYEKKSSEVTWSKIADICVGSRTKKIAVKYGSIINARGKETESEARNDKLKDRRARPEIRT